MDTNKQNENKSKFKWFYSSYSKDSSWKTTKDERVFNDYEAYVEFMKEKWNDFFIETKSFFDKELTPVFWKFLGVINDWLDKWTKYINNAIDEIEKSKQNNKSDIVSSYKKELELEKQKKSAEKNDLLKQRDELLQISKEFKDLGNNEKVKELEIVIKGIEMQLNNYK